MPQTHSPGRRSGGRLVAEALAANGVEAVFCVPGESYLEILDALHDTNIQVVTCRQEGGAAFMAEAWGKLSGKVGVVLATRGPGASNAAIGIHTARQDSTALLMLLGDVGRDFMDREAFQEVDFPAMFAPLSKWAVRVEQAGRLPEYLGRAFSVAKAGRPGPAVLALPEDLLRETCSAPEAAAPLPPVHGKPAVEDLVALRKLMAESKRPLIVVGGGGWTEEGRQALARFAQASDLPVACSFRRLDLLAGDHPCFAGDLGLGPDPQLIAKAKAADLLILLGTRFSEIASQGYELSASQKLVHIHPEAEELGRVHRPGLAVACDPSEFARGLAALPPLLALWPEWRKELRAARLAWAKPRATGGLFDAGLAMEMLESELPGDAIVTVDAGNFAGWPQRFLTFGKRRFLGPACGAMGYGVPAAVAAALARPGQLVAGFVGDGGILMTGQEIATALQHGAAPIILVFDNGMFGTIRMHQESRHPSRVMATRLENPDFAAWARSFGAHGETVAATDDFLPAFRRARECGRAALLHLKTDPEIITPRSTLSDLRLKAQGA
jgi:acetolactate synthase-1/2/3 large subunit